MRATPPPRTPGSAGRSAQGYGATSPFTDGVADLWARVVRATVDRAERSVARVAHLSLVAQTRAEALIDRRWDVASFDTDGPGRLLARAAADLTQLAERLRSARREAVLRMRGAHAALERSGAQLQPKVERALAHGAVRRALRASVTAGSAGLVGVLVLGIGGGGGAVMPTEASMPPPSPTSFETTVVDPAVPVGSSGAAPAPHAERAPEPPPSLVSARMAPPVALRVPAIDVDASVVVVGLEPDGAMEIPADVRTVGWYEPFAGAGVAPGEPGTAVIAGHVDSRTQGRGAFWPLRELIPGDVVEVEHADGTATRWRVESVVRHPKTDLPIDEIFTFGGDERLALITCGGEFDRSVGAYLDNYVVTAVPLDPIVAGPAQLLPAAP